MYDYKKGNYNQLIEHVEYTISDLSLVLHNNNNIELAWNQLKYVIVNACNCHIPNISKKSKKYPVWYTAEISHKTNVVNTLKCRMRKCQSDKCSATLEKQECELPNIIAIAKLKYEMNLIHHDRTMIYKYPRIRLLYCSIMDPSFMIHQI